MKVKLPSIVGKGPVKIQVYAKTFAAFDKDGVAEVSDLIGKILLTKQADLGYVEVVEKSKEEVKEEPKEPKEKKIPKEPKIQPDVPKTFLDEVKG